MIGSFFTSVDAATGQTLFTGRVGLGRAFASGGGVLYAVARAAED